MKTKINLGFSPSLPCKGGEGRGEEGPSSRSSAMNRRPTFASTGAGIVSLFLPGTCRQRDGHLLSPALSSTSWKRGRRTRPRYLIQWQCTLTLSPKRAREYDND